MMPGGSGIQFIKQLKQDEVTRQIPVVMLTARGEEEDKVRGLEAGADDYITKPFSPKELTARLHAVMRRVSPTSVDEVIEVQGLKLDPVSHRVSAEEKALDMGPTEFKLLHFFMTHPSGSTAVNSCSTMSGVPMCTSRTEPWMCIFVACARRLKRPGHDRLIQTVRGAGYRFSTRL